MSASFDTHQYAQRAVSAGLSQAAADFLAESLAAITRDVAALAANAKEREMSAETAYARLESKIDSVEAKQESRVAQLDAKIDSVEARQESRATRLDAKIDTLAAEMRAQIAAQSALIERNAKEITHWLMGVVISMGLLQSALVTGLVLKLVH